MQVGGFAVVEGPGAEVIGPVSLPDWAVLDGSATNDGPLDGGGLE